MFERLKRDLHSAFDPSRPGAQRPQPTIDTLLPGDVVSLWDAGDHVVQAVLDCREELNGRQVGWRWNLLDDGWMISSAPEGQSVFDRTAIVLQSSAEFETLTADPDQGGALKAFEARVRQGTAARNPTLFEFEGKVYRVVSTGIFEAQSLEQVSYPNLPVWRDINASNPGDNVYFELEPTEDVPDTESGAEVIGIWTTHIALLFGRTLKDADVQSIYPRSEEGGTQKH